MRWWRRVYWVAGGAAVVLYAAGELYGWETGTEAREVAGPGVRGGAGYRTWTYWHGGYRRGK